MKSISPYLNFNGNTEEAFNFYKSVFGGEFKAIQRFKDVPGTNVSEADADKIMHIALPIGADVILMATDALESMGQHLVEGNNFYITIDTESKEEADSLFAKLSEGGKSELAMEKTFWNAYFGMFRDKFGINWMIIFDLS